MTRTRLSPSGPEIKAEGSFVTAAYGSIPGQVLPAGPFRKVSSDAVFDFWIPDSVVSIHAAFSVSGAGDFPAFGVSIRPAVSLDDGASWLWIQFDPAGSIVRASSSGNGDTTGSISLVAAVKCATKPRVSLWNDGGGAIAEGSTFACYLTRASVSPPETSLVAM